MWLKLLVTFSVSTLSVLSHRETCRGSNVRTVELSILKLRTNVTSAPSSHKKILFFFLWEDLILCASRFQAYFNIGFIGEHCLAASSMRGRQALDTQV